MASYTTTYTFTSGTKIKASEANANFSNISSFLNDSVIHVDGSKSFTGIPTVSGAAAVNPSSANQLTRKQYVDDQDTAISTTVTANKTAADNAFLVRPTFSGSNNQIVKIAETVVTTDANGEATITFPVAFPNTLVTVVVSNGDIGSGTGGLESVSVGVVHSSKTRTSFKVRAYDSSTFSGELIRHYNQPLRVSYVAIGT